MNKDLARNNETEPSSGQSFKSPRTLGGKVYDAIDVASSFNHLQDKQIATSRS